MYFRRLFAACAACVLGVMLVESVHAYPVTARTGATTVTGMYRPLNLDLALVNGTDALSYDTGTGDFGFFATYSGDYTGVGYAASGFAGSWELNIQSFGNSTVFGNTITVSPTDPSGFVGSFTYVGGGNFAGVPSSDTPQLGDMFDLFAVGPGAFMQVVCEDGVLTCQSFTLTLLQDLEHRGPFVPDSIGVDGPRLNEDCLLPGSEGRCGLVSKDNFNATSIPEPASLALVGVALGALAWGRRRSGAR